VRSFDFGRYALCSCVVAAMLAGCGEPQPPIGAPGAVPQSRVVATHAAHGTSWMLPEAKGEDRLYVGSAIGAYVLSYPGGQPQGQIDSVSEAVRLCSDWVGNGYILSSLSARGDNL